MNERHELLKLRRLINLAFVIFFTAFPTLAKPKRYIIHTGDLGRVEKLALFFNSQVLKKLDQDHAIVIRGEEKDARKLAFSLGVHQEEDTIFSVPRFQAGRVRRSMVQTIPWGITKIRALEAVTRGDNTIVCVSDTGIDLRHSDLRGNIIGHFNTIDSSKSGNDNNGHGTHVAGIIAALDNRIGVVGVASRAKLIAAKGLGANGTGYSSDLAETIDGCRIRGAQIINLSWGSATSSSVIHAAVMRAEAAGIMMIGAAGNESSGVIYPAAYPEVVAVSAVDINDAFASFSNFGADVEIAAPGVGILSTYRGRTYRSLNGTSMAAPHVSGVAALVLSLIPGATREDLIGIDIGLPVSEQGIRGRIDAILSTVR